MDVGKILIGRADELVVCATELRDRVGTFLKTGDSGPVTDGLTLLTQLLVGMTGIGAFVAQKAAREQTEAALERVQRMLDPRRAGDMT